MSQPPLQLSEFLDGYLAEVDDHLASATRNLLAIEANLKRGQPSPRAVREMYRALHTIKGLSAMVGVEPVVEVAHAMEALLRTIDRAGGVLEEKAVDVLSTGVRAIEQRVGCVARSEPVAAAPTELLDRFVALGEETAEPTRNTSDAGALRLPADIADRLTPSERAQLVVGSTGTRRAIRVDFVPSPERAAAGVTISSVRQSLAARADIVKILPLSRSPEQGAPAGLAFAILALSEATPTEIAALAQADAADVAIIVDHKEAPADVAADPDADPDAGHPDDETAVERIEATGRRTVVRVDVRRLDDALDKLSDLVVTRFRLERAVAALVERGVDVRELKTVVVENGRQLKDLRAAIMLARMVPISELLDRLPLLVRGIARTTGKSVELEIDAGKAELDKTVAERVFPAIVHLVRNAVDHAIEPAAQRRSAGKPSQGRLRVSCFQRGHGQLELAVSDDGRGIDRVRVAARARREVPETDEALLALITTPGLSTRDEVTTTSGRGMGMDIVRRVVVDELGGELSLETWPDKGTTFTIRIPLTITIVDAFSFRCGPQPFVVPVGMVDEIVELDTLRVTRIPSGKGRADIRMIERNGTAMPLVSLKTVFRLADADGPSRPKGIVVRRQGQPLAFEVDRMLGHQEVVVRPLDDPSVRVPGIVGSTDLGDGQPTLVLDLVALSGRLSRRRTDKHA